MKVTVREQNFADRLKWLRYFRKFFVLSGIRAPKWIVSFNEVNLHDCSLRLPVEFKKKKRTKSTFFQRKTFTDPMWNHRLRRQRKPFDFRSKLGWRFNNLITFRSERSYYFTQIVWFEWLRWLRLWTIVSLSFYSSSRPL